MVLRLYDSRASALREFVPLTPGRVGLYVCGPTVQSTPHIGHLRSALSYDILRRWLEYRGLVVTLVRNVTDIDDKILVRSQETSEEWWALAYRVELEFTAAYAAINVLPPTYEPRATASITEMQQLIERLVDAGHAYPAADGSGDVYFDTGSWPAYGELTRQKAADMIAAEDADPRAKRDSRDFALWKGQKPTEPSTAAWESPWGRGRPGWHIECSAMSARYLGTAFDIHGGGLDLRFPHHENELAQSTADGQQFARYWVHNGLVTVGGQKMSKSLGNSIFAADVLGSARGVVVRYALGAAHYRSVLDLHDGALVEAEEAVGRIERFLARVPFAQPTSVPEAFAAAMDDDLGTPQAIASLHETVRAGNVAVDEGRIADATTAAAAVRAMLAVLGLDFGPGETDSAARGALGALLDRLLVERAAARAARDWVGADRIRDTIAAAGVTLEDGADGTTWSIDG